MILSATDLENLHRRLAPRVGSILGEVTVGACTGHEGWRNHATGSVEFALYAKGGRGMEYTPRNRGSDCPVFLLAPADVDVLQPGLWVGWREEWAARGGRRFSLWSASWSFFWGLQRRPKEQLFRAEFEDVREREQPMTAGQPHWHFDRSGFPPSDLPVGEVAAEGGVLEEQPVLREIADMATGRDQIDLARFHLAMGGWDHSKDHPACWQHRIENVDTLLEWAARTLVYAEQEFARALRLPRD